MFPEGEQERLSMSYPVPGGYSGQVSCLLSASELSLCLQAGGYSGSYSNNPSYTSRSAIHSLQLKWNSLTNQSSYLNLGDIFISALMFDLHHIYRKGSYTSRFSKS